ncbi:MAG: hypothetical protein EAZ89_14535 [Bacteroidetes bacterium]|nr:MAG: hypothetical protein EAZ89_14535 [Bacteroidota bacterium]
MALTFTDHLNRLLANNRPDQALEAIFQAISLFKKKYPEKAAEVDELETQLIMISARMKDLQNKEQTIQLSANEVEVARAKLFSSLIGTIKGITDVPVLGDFLSKEESVLPDPNPAPQVKQPIIEPPQPQVRPAFSAPQPVTSAAPGTPSKKFPVLPVAIGAGVVVLLIIAYVVISNNQNKPAAPKANTATASVSSENSKKDSTNWAYAQKTGTREAYELYLTNVENGIHAAEAQQKLGALSYKEDTKLWEEAKAANTLQAYEEYKEKSPMKLFSAEADNAIKEVLANQSGSAQLKKLILMSSSDTLTASEKISKLKEGLAVPKLSAADKAEINKYIAHYDSLTVGAARLNDPENDMVTARSVSNLNPSGADSEFAPGKVNVWARIDAPGSESVQFRWFDASGKQIDVDIASVSNSGAYRTYKDNSFNQPGKYEVRLYNAKNALIGRKVFVIK